MKFVRRSRRRRAMLVMTVLACLTLVMLLMVAWLKIAALERGQLRAQQNLMQAEYLATSALSRAAARLAADPNYEGETLSPTAEMLATSTGATVTIRVEAVEDDPLARRVSATAQISAAGARGALRNKQQTIHLPPEGHKEPATEQETEEASP